MTLEKFLVRREIMYVAAAAAVVFLVHTFKLRQAEVQLFEGMNLNPETQRLAFRLAMLLPTFPGSV